ncbi:MULTISPECIES: nitrogenase component 1 [unclassified Methanosarcina]|uniref:nitrogenase component 1 n=1 Tax=unclassified Methanosarcina TaxID=2644672 RepID=UPI0006156D29|nr:MULTISPECIES: nitrogenase component 1 [unclassified Methanosarcina]AKB18538.1 Nitrogenase (molybdenum-iron) reductase and maturation protein NifH [Methanosarcina sp. WWM596]AKB21897.1 Nitrogenase (molybdenum-iron) reductase and maturation protein NifH [Methanosarcina sp. WH1]
MIQIALYGKGGIGKSTVAANLSAALAGLKKRVLQVGCDPKHDSTRLLLGGAGIPTVLDYMLKTPLEAQQLEALVFEGYGGTACVEAGGPKPGVGCAGRGILSSFEVLKRLGLRNSSFDVVLYDVLGDVVCGGFAVPLRKEYADAVFLVTSGEYMALYAANNILRGIRNFEDAVPRVAGIIFNGRGLFAEEERVFAFARAVGLPVLISLPRDEVFFQAEKAGKTLAEAFPFSAPAGIFRELAGYVETLEKDRSLLHPANPLGDLELETLVLGKRKLPNRKPFVPGSAPGKKPGVEPGSPNREKGSSSEICKAIPEGQSVEISAGVPDTKSAGTPTEASAPPPSAPPTRLPLYGCAFSGATTATFQVNDAATVLHGPRSCTHITADALSCSFLRGGGINAPTREEKQIPCLLSTDMEEEDVIFGGLEKLERKIEEALSAGWQTVFVVNTCPGGIIGDDIREAASRTEVRFPGARVIPVPVEGVLTGDFSAGLLEGYKRVADLIDPSGRPEKGLVNVIGERSFSLRGEEDFRTVEKLLGKLGYGVNCRFLKGTDTFSLRSFKKAEINLLACNDPETRALQTYLSERFGLEFFELPFPVGFRKSSIWIKTLAARLLPGKDLSFLLQEQEEAYKAGIGKYAPHLSGKRVLLVSYTKDISWILDTIRDLGMEILKVGIPVSFFGRESPGLLSHEGFQVERNYTDERRARDVRDLRPDLVLSSYVPSVPEEGVHYDTIPFSPQVGFLSGLELAKRWSTLLRLPVMEGWKYDGGDES